MTGIGIMGAGISGLTLALRLQQLGVATTLYSEGDADGCRTPWAGWAARRPASGRWAARTSSTPAAC
ncbi:hypothetical protein [Nonomuraea sp. NPDC052265]|uniref:hypothetical protein n=1 Tax=Nonomuraea sp. NPDC052265 TaxID=3364374 RepID=UPI0037CB9E8C